MKQIFFPVLLLLCLIGLTGLTSYENTSYTVQVAASKTPSDIKWFTSRYHIESPIREVKEDGWYKYVIGEFQTKSEAINYIFLHLQSKDLQGPFPRSLPDSLRQNQQAEAAPVMAIEPDQKESPSTAQIPSASTKVVVPRALNPSPGIEYQSPVIQDQFDNKYSPWGRLIRRINLRKVEMIMIEGITPILPQSLVPYYIRMIDSAIRFPVVLFFLMLVILFALNALLVMIVLEMTNTVKNRNERLEDLYRNMYERAMTGYIFQEYDLETAVRRIKKIHLSRNRKILVSVLFNFQKNLSGELDQKLLAVFSRLGLHKDAEKRTRSSSFYHQIKGLSELTNLYPAGAFSIVKGLINDKNNELRAEAQTSYVRLNHDEPFLFLKSLTKPFTQWTQLTSFYIFRLHKLPAPSFVEYLKSDLYNVQNFSLRMIIYFQQKENAQDILKLLSAKRERTRFLAIKACNELGIQEAKPMLKQAYETETYKNKLEIIKYLLQMGNFQDFEFLEKIIRQKDVTLKIEACRSMYFMNSSGMENLLRLEMEKELDIEPYIAHIYDPRN